MTLRVASSVAWRLIVVAAAIVLGGLALAELRLVVLPVIAALILGTVLRPPVRWLRRRGWSAGLAAFTVVVLGVVGLGGVVAVLAPPVAGELRELDLNLQEGFETAVGWVVEGPFGISEEDVEEAIDRGAQALRENADTLALGAVSGAVVAGELVIGALLTLVLLFFGLRDSDQIASWFIGLAARHNRERVREGGARAWEALGGYVRGQTLVALFDAVFIGLGLWLLGVPLVLPLAVLTFFAAYIPVAGAIVAGLAAALVALVTEGPAAAAAVTVLVIVVQQVESNVWQPVVVGRAVRVHPAAIALSVTGGAVVAGVVGALLAVPTVAVAAAVAPVVRGTAPADEETA